MPLDLTLFRKARGGDPEKVREWCRKRFSDESAVDRVIELDERVRAASYAVNNLRAEKSKLSKEVGALRKAKKDAGELQARIKGMGAEIKEKDEALAAATAERDAALREVGNEVHESVPVSKDERDNRVEAEWGECKRTGKELHHHELLHMIDGYCSEQGARIAGHRGYFLKGVGVLLNSALQNFGLNFLVRRGYTPVQPPFFMRPDVMARTAQLSEFDEALYKVTGEGDKDDMYLIATSEQPISALHMGEHLTAKQLPMRYAGISTCFRKEAGAHGRDCWGIFRVHQFEKVEQFVLCEPDKSWEMHAQMSRVAEEFYQALGLSYRVVNIVSGELNNAAAKKLDLEAWFPALGEFRELVSASNCTDYQSRGMETRFGFGTGERDRQYCHMLNATLCATTRTMCCILENYQREDGVVVPEVLRPYMGGLEFLPFVKERPVNANAAKAERAAKKKSQHAGAQKAKAEKKKK